MRRRYPPALSPFFLSLSLSLCAHPLTLSGGLVPPAQRLLIRLRHTSPPRDVQVAELILGLGVGRFVDVPCVRSHAQANTVNAQAKRYPADAVEKTW